MKTLKDILADAKYEVAEIGPERLSRRIAEGQSPPVLVDVREPDEYREGHLPGAIGLSRGVLEFKIAQAVPDRDAEIVVYCRSGQRSALAASTLQQMGYTRVYSLRGGYEAWSKAGEKPDAYSI